MKKFTIQICLLGYQRYLDKIEKLQNYSSNLKKLLFYKIIDFAKERPILSLVITSISTIIINVLSSLLYELLKLLF